MIRVVDAFWISTLIALLTALSVGNIDAQSNVQCSLQQPYSGSANKIRVDHNKSEF